jgi:hypothetical protein
MKGTVSPLSTYVTKIVKGGKILNVWDVPLTMFFYFSLMHERDTCDLIKYNFLYSFLIYFIPFMQFYLFY